MDGSKFLCFPWFTENSLVCVILRYTAYTLMGPILFLYYEESLVSSNLNSKLLRFHCAHPTVHLKKLKKNEINYCLPTSLYNFLPHH